MNIACPECSTVYRVDPERIPGDGVAARCRECGTAFTLDPALGPTPPGETITARRVNSEGGAGRTAEAGTATVAPSSAAGTGAGSDEAGEPETPVFGPQDPDTRARRLARALVSDIKAYHPEKWQAAMEAGTLRREFRDEILKSWDEYVEQVGEELAKKTPYFRTALNEILAQGKAVF